MTEESYGDVAQRQREQATTNAEVLVFVAGAVLVFVAGAMLIIVGIGFWFGTGPALVSGGAFSIFLAAASNAARERAKRGRST